MAFRWLAPAALLLAAPGLAQAPAPSPVAEVGAWLGRFVAAMAEPGRVAAECGPQLNAAMSAMRDAASARAALPTVQACGARLSAAYENAGRALELLGPLDPALEAGTQFNSRQLIAEHRRLAESMADYVESANQFVAAMAADNRAALPGLAARVRSGGATIIDASILQMRVQTAASPLEFARRGGELRIIVAEAGRALLTSAVSPAGVAAGPLLATLGKRAEATATAGRSGWERDRFRLANGGPAVQRVVATADEMAEAVFAQGDRLAALLANQPNTLSFPTATKLATDLNIIELAMLSAGQQFAATLQKSN